MFGISEIAIILIVVILLLGAKKLPDLARSAGKAARILKSEGKAMKADGAPEPQATYQVTESAAPRNPMRPDGRQENERP
ncbi:Sec-independent protein translocase subunit TatA [Streptomyces sp. NPDC056944]|uniref:Sec-independent protein translocase subunit TatA n=1 Tax=Streptomyces sp. NPDC056944 TaxID=3345972 RepID=UPI00364060C6